MQRWIEIELAGADLGDARREQRLRTLVSQLSRNPQGTFNHACPTAAHKKAAYRFFDNDQVEPQQVLASHVDRTWRRMGAYRRVLVVQDTTSLNYVTHPAAAGLGRLENAHARGFLLHSALAVSEDGEPLGLVHQETWARDEQPAKGGHERPWVERESYKWQRTVEAVAKRAVEGGEYIIIGDRESDVYGLLASHRPAGIELLVRSAQNRRVEEHPGGLHEAATSGPAAGTMVVEVGRGAKRTPRKARCEVRYRQLTLRPPTPAAPGVSAEPIEIWVVAIVERHPPRGEAPLCWILIATWPVTSLEEAVRCARLYSRRWLVERYHFVLKSGCSLEHKQLRERIRLERVQAVYAIVAWRLLSITYQARIHPQGSCEPMFTGTEWQVLYAYHHQQAYPAGAAPPTMEQAVQWVGKLGGHWGRRGDGAPGVKILWQGLTKLAALVEGFTLSQTLLQGARSG
jgi:hypothetical protein